MAETLREYLSKNPPTEFESSAEYFAVGDFVTYFTKPEMYYARRIDGLVTVYHSEKTDEVIGFKIKSVLEILKSMARWNVPSLKFQYDDEGLSLSLLFMAASEMSQPNAKERYQELARLAKDAVIKRESLPSIAV
jgi:hypothetical protein